MAGRLDEAKKYIELFRSSDSILEEVYMYWAEA